MTAPTLAARNLGWALALGICLGLVYGLLRPLRRRRLCGQLHRKAVIQRARICAPHVLFGFHPQDEHAKGRQLKCFQVILP